MSEPKLKTQLNNAIRQISKLEAIIIDLESRIEKLESVALKKPEESDEIIVEIINEIIDRPVKTKKVTYITNFAPNSNPGYYLQESDTESSSDR